jgi:hypothetical protein
LLVSGCWLLAAGRWLLAAGSSLLVAGCLSFFKVSGVGCQEKIGVSVQVSGVRFQRTEVRCEKVKKQSQLETNRRISKEKKTSSFEIPCSIFDIQNRRNF